MRSLRIAYSESEMLVWAIFGSSLRFVIPIWEMPQGGYKCTPADASGQREPLDDDKTSTACGVATTVSKVM